MDPLIPIINDLQDVSNSVGVRELRLDLPQTVVIGAQSAGKSSVIEGFVGRDFLPRGTGVVTRNPLMLHLVYVAKGDARRDRDSRLRECDWAVFSHKPNELFLDFKDGVRKEIERKTEELSGSNKNISKTPIILTIYSDSVANLSLVDLPGVTKVKAGDQPDDIEKQTTDIVLEYISKPKSIILAVTPANQDFHTSESVKLAQQVDPKGKRTLVVLTKLDIMDAGTDAKDLLEGRVENVKHMGIIGVVGRSQEDTNNGKPVADGLLAEEDFFRRKYPDIAHKNGIKFLATALNRVMIKHIKKSLPMLLEQIGSEKNKFEMIKESFGSPVQLENKGDAVLYFISHFEKKYKATIQGGDECVEVNELSCGAQIALVTHETLREKLSTIWKTLTPNEVAVAIENVSGTQRPLYMPEAAFRVLVELRSKPMGTAAGDCVEKVDYELRKNVKYCIQKVEGLQTFPKLQEAISQVVNAYLDKKKKETKDYVEKLVSVQKSYVNTEHPDFQKGIKDQPNPMARVKLSDDDATENRHLPATKDKPTHATKADCDLTTELTAKYVNVVIKELESQLRKAVNGLFVDEVCDKVKDELFAKLLMPQSEDGDVLFELDALLAEDEQRVQERDYADRMIQLLTDATAKIGEISATTM